MILVALVLFSVSIAALYYVGDYLFTEENRRP